MGVLQTEIVKSDSPVWVSLKHVLLFLLFFVLSIAFWGALGLLIMTITHFKVNLFGFYFSSPLQDFLLLFFSTLTATLTSFFFVRKGITFSTLRSTSLHLVAFAFLLTFVTFNSSPDPHYGRTTMDNFYSDLLTYPLIILEFFGVSLLLLKKFKNKTWST